MFNTLLQKLSTMLQENSGGSAWSSTRFAFIFAVLISNIVIFITLTVLTIKGGAFPDIPEGILWLYALANGIAFTGKVSQKFKETSTPIEEPKDNAKTEIKQKLTEI